MENSVKPSILDIPKVHDPRGNLSFVESDAQVPFSIERVFYLYDVPADSERGGHSHHEAWQFLIAVAGSFDVVIDNGFDKKRFTLNRPYRGLLIPPGYWRTMDNFSSGSVCMVITNIKYSETDYIRDYDEFLRISRQNPQPI